MAGEGTSIEAIRGKVIDLIAHRTNSLPLSRDMETYGIGMKLNGHWKQIQSLR
jgi:hypothetical protein